MEGKPQKLNILELKDRFLLTIFGSYDNNALVQLNRLKECLVEKGFVKCRLVSDYRFPTKKRNEDNDQYFRRKSIYWLENSDSCIFVFLHDSNNEGVAYELKHTCDHLESKLTTCLVVIESKCVKYSTSLLRGSVTNLVKQQKINRRFFKGESQLCKFCSSAAISFMKEGRYYLWERLKSAEEY
jgi:hypothetical protein